MNNAQTFSIVGMAETCKKTIHGPCCNLFLIAVWSCGLHKKHASTGGLVSKRGRNRLPNTLKRMLLLGMNFEAFWRGCLFPQFLHWWLVSVATVLLLLFVFLSLLQDFKCGFEKSQLIGQRNIHWLFVLVWHGHVAPQQLEECRHSTLHQGTPTPLTVS